MLEWRLLLDLARRLRRSARGHAGGSGRITGEIHRRDGACGRPSAVTWLLKNEGRQVLGRPSKVCLLEDPAEVPQANVAQFAPPSITVERRAPAGWPPLWAPLETKNPMLLAEIRVVPSIVIVVVI